MPKLLQSVTKVALPVLMIVALVAGGGWFRSCQSVDKLAVRVGQLQANLLTQAQETAAAKQSAAEAIANSLETEAENAKLEAKIKATETLLQTGLAGVDALEAQLASAQGAEAENVILKQQKQGLGDAVTQALGVIESQKVEIVSLKLDITSLRTEIARSAKVIVDQDALLKQAESVVNGLVKRQSKASLELWLDRAVIGGLVVALAMGK